MLTVVMQTDDVMLPAQVLRYSSCIRTTLLLLGGYECQESEVSPLCIFPVSLLVSKAKPKVSDAPTHLLNALQGVFMIAFDDTRTAVEWAISVQACLLR